MIMDRKIRRQIIEMLHDIAKGLDYSQASSSAAMLEECIAALQSIRDILASFFSPARFAVYDEVLWGIIQALTKGVQQNLAGRELQDTCNLMAELLKHLESLLLKEKEIKKEIVFLPYKASMWDSLETVWRAAYEDKEHCNAYVVPIPYAERNRDGTAREWHHEIGLFPDYVPVIDYHMLNLEKLHPDIIFIHNPYDHRNLVTSVDETFYSYNIKQYTDNLLYIPYCVSGTYVSQDMCETSALEHADHVIVESESIKAQYEKYYPYGPVPEGKFLALGSPKYDKVKLARKEKYPLPKEWADLVKEKKVILYATTIHDQLANYEMTIQKLESILEFFKQRDDVVLWWRPHPLLQNTFDTMLPSICDKYRAIVERYKAEGWGIYDESGDLDCAIAWSDAYYGDRSSLISLYRETGKPVVLTELSKITDDCEDIVLTFTKPCFVNEIIYFTSAGSDFLFAYNWETGTVNTVDILKHSPEGEYGAFGGVVQIEKGLLAYPCDFSSVDFVEYNLFTKEQNITSYQMFSPVLDGLKFFRNFKYKDSIYFAKCSSPEVVEYNLQTKKYRVEKASLKMDVPWRDDLGYRYCAECINNYIVFLPLALKVNYVIVFDIEKKVFFKKNIGDIEAECCSMYQWRDKLFIETKTLGILKWDVSKKTFEHILISNELYHAGTIYGVCEIDGELFVIIHNMNCHLYCYVLSFSESNNISKINLLNNVEKVTCLEQVDESRYFISGVMGQKSFLGFIDLCTGSSDIRYMNISKKMGKMIVENTLKVCNRRTAHMESEYLTPLALLIDFLKTDKTLEYEEPQNLVGEKIYHFFTSV